MLDVVARVVAILFQDNNVKTTTFRLVHYLSRLFITKCIAHKGLGQMFTIEFIDPKGRALIKGR